MTQKMTELSEAIERAENFIKHTEGTGPGEDYFAGYLRTLIQAAKRASELERVLAWYGDERNYCDYGKLLSEVQQDFGVRARDAVEGE